MKVQVKAATAFEGPAYHYTGEDGYPAAALIPVVVAETADGNKFQLVQDVRKEYDEDGFGPYIQFRFNLQKAKEIAHAVEARGFIESDHWAPVTDDALQDYLVGAYGFAA